MHYDWPRLGTPLNNDSTFKMWLPTTINVWADVNIVKGFGWMLQLQINPIPQKEINVHHLSIVSVTPRYDYKWAGVYMPVAVDQITNVQWGLGFRAGPLYLPSQDIFSSLIKMRKGNTRRDINVQISLKFLYLTERQKIETKTSYLTKKDLCPAKKELTESHGCRIEMATVC